jgi:hypothetical protein
MPRKTPDASAHLPLSRQRKYQLRRLRDHGCTECGDPIFVGSRCLKHLLIGRGRARKILGLEKRYRGGFCYKPQMGAT